MKDNLVIFWFRRDLRLKDNAGLFHALNENDKVLPIFIYDKNTLDKLNKSDHRVDFIEYSLKKMNDLLKKNNKSISIYYGKPVKVFSELIKKYNVTKVYSNKDYTPYSIKRDKKVEELLKVNNIDFNSYKDHVLFEKYEVVKDDNTPYKVYTPFSRKWLIKMSENKIDFFNSEKYIHKFFNEKREFLSLKEIGFEKSVLSPLNLNLSSDTINNYEKTRNFPYVNGTSKIGLHLRFGTISTREMIIKAEVSKIKLF